jgi:hypothetical protein
MIAVSEDACDLLSFKINTSQVHILFAKKKMPAAKPAFLPPPPRQSAVGTSAAVDLEADEDLEDIIATEMANDIERAKCASLAPTGDDIPATQARLGTNCMFYFVTIFIFCMIYYFVVALICTFNQCSLKAAASSADAVVITPKGKAPMAGTRASPRTPKSAKAKSKKVARIEPPEAPPDGDIE